MPSHERNTLSFYWYCTCRNSLLFTLLSILVTGCTSKLEKWDPLFEQGQYNAASIQAEAWLEEDGSDAVLWYLQSGYLQWLTRQYSTSYERFDEAESRFKDDDVQSMTSKVGSLALSMMMNESTITKGGRGADEPVWRPCVFR